jgi:hypothetical protein
MFGGFAMSALTIRWPGDKHQRPKVLATSKPSSIHKLMNKLATVALANHAARARFATRASRGNRKRASIVVDKLDRTG